MNKQLRKLLAAALLLACLPVGAQGTESSQETVSKETGLSEGALIDVSIWQADEWTAAPGWRKLAANQQQRGNAGLDGRGAVGEYALAADRLSRLIRRQRRCGT